MNPRTYRKERGLTLQDMAEMVGAANASVISKNEKGITFPKPDRVERYRKATGGAVTYQDWQELRRRAARKSTTQNRGE